MKALKFEKGESTKAYVNRITGKYLEKQDRAVSIGEVRQFFLAQGNPTVKNMAESAFSKMVEKQIVDHAVKYM